MVGTGEDQLHGRFTGKAGGAQSHASDEILHININDLIPRRTSNHHFLSYQGQLPNHWISTLWTDAGTTLQQTAANLPMNPKYQQMADMVDTIAQKILSCSEQRGTIDVSKSQWDFFKENLDLLDNASLFSMSNKENPHQYVTCFMFYNDAREMIQRIDVPSKGAAATPTPAMPILIP